MNRRRFLGLLATVPVAIAAGDELAELLAPRRTIFLPPRARPELNLARYFTSNQAWFIKTEVDNPVRFFRRPLTEDTLEQLVGTAKHLAEQAGVPLSLKPTRLIVHPSWTVERIEARLAKL